MIIRDGQVLLTHYQTGALGGWTLPGGGLETGESPAECCIREVAEETGYQVRLTGLVDVDSFWISAAERLAPNGQRPLFALKVIYHAEIIGGEFQVEVDGSTDDAAWVPIADLDPYAGPGDWPVNFVRLALGD